MTAIAEPITGNVARAMRSRGNQASFPGTKEIVACAARIQANATWKPWPLYMHHGQCFAPCMWMLHAAEAPAHQARHPQAKIQAQKLMERAAVGMAAAAKINPRPSGLKREGIGVIINRRNRFAPEGV